jgi:hypothetical protein
MPGRPYHGGYERDQTGHANPKDWAGLNAEETDNPSGVSGLQIDGYFPDDSRTNTNNDHNRDSQFVVRLPDEWNGKVAITGASGNRPQYANDFIMSDWLLDRGYAFASTDKGNTGEEFYETGENPGDSIAEWNYRVEELTRATKTVVERYYAQGPRFTYITGISNGWLLGPLRTRKHAGALRRRRGLGGQPLPGGGAEPPDVPPASG